MRETIQLHGFRQSGILLMQQGGFLPQISAAISFIERFTLDRILTTGYAISFWGYIFLNYAHLDWSIVLDSSHKVVIQLLSIGETPEFSGDPEACMRNFISSLQQTSSSRISWSSEMLSVRASAFSTYMGSPFLIPRASRVTSTVKKEHVLLATGIFAQDTPNKV